jgi:16S rRNA (uracil1498-N3)-methyltransferase
LAAGLITLDPGGARHVRDVLRLTQGATVEVFDDAGAVGQGTLVEVTPRSVVVRVEQFSNNADVANLTRLTVASAVPKGDRADWMIEKLSELGVERFIPLAAARSVVLPEGKNKHERWVRIATEAAKQSRRRGVMTIDPLTRVSDALNVGDARVLLLSTAPDAQPIYDALRPATTGTAIRAFIGPEGGWTDDEISAITSADALGVKLTSTVLRVETAAIAVAAIIASLVHTDDG